MRCFSFISLAFLLLVSCEEKQSFEQMANDMAGDDFPVIYLEALHDSMIFLDCRTKEEFEISHIPGALWMGENYNAALPLDNNSTLVVYCSVGYRSRLIGEALREKGYKKVYNLWGGIFHWSNEGKNLVDAKGKETNQVHAYNKKWSKWLKTEEKIYD